MSYKLTKPDGSVLPLPNFHPNNCPKPMRSLAKDDIELGHKLLSEYLQETSPSKKQKLLEAILFHHAFIGAVYHGNQQRAAEVGMSKDDYRQSERERRAASFDAMSATTIEFEPLTSTLDTDANKVQNSFSSYSSPSEILAEQHDMYVQARAKQSQINGRKNTKKQKINPETQLDNSSVKIKKGESK